MQEMDAKRSTKLPQRESAEENDRADTLSDACQVGDTDGDVPVTQSTPTKSTEAPEATQEAPLCMDDELVTPASSVGAVSTCIGIGPRASRGRSASCWALGA